MSDQLESELKIPVSDLNTVREALVRQAATQTHAMVREFNILLDTDDGRLRRSASILRLRTYGEHHVVTFKGPVEYLGRIKQRRECEVSCGDTGRMAEVFASLGFSVVARYEKDRETWLCGQVEVAIDRTPMGNFVEVEGPRETLEATAVSLGLDPETAVSGSYLSLWSEYRQRHGEQALPQDMVFPE